MTEETVLETVVQDNSVTNPDNSVTEVTPPKNLREELAAKHKEIEEQMAKLEEEERVTGQKPTDVYFGDTPPARNLLEKSYLARNPNSTDTKYMVEKYAGLLDSVDKVALSTAARQTMVDEILKAEAQKIAQKNRTRDVDQLFRKSALTERFGSDGSKKLEDMFRAHVRETLGTDKILDAMPAIEYVARVSEFKENIDNKFLEWQRSQGLPNTPEADMTPEQEARRDKIAEIIKKFQ